MAAEPKMPEGLKRLPGEYQQTDDGIERLIKLISQSDKSNKKQVSDLAKVYRAEIKSIIKEQDKAQKEAAFYIAELRKAGATDREIAAYLKKNVKLKSGGRPAL
jgi:intergrase/recombinase